MQYDEALDYIHNTLKFGIKLGLHNISTLLELMGNPHHKLKYVHVAGTNGKGSTVAFISNILIESGYKVGTYTSPYLERFTERMKINNIEIAQDDLARITGFVKEKVELMVERGDNHPTEFEIVTAVAFQYFYESSCDIVVLEVGLGGRFDSTNIIKTPLVSVITTISYDHMDRLGNTLPEIAFEKAGIIKEGGEVVVYPQKREVEEVFEAACNERGAILHKADFKTINVIEGNVDGQKFDYAHYKGLSISLLGLHQVKNAVVALNTIEILKAKGYKITEESLRTGLANTKWPGRLEVVGKQPVFLIDGAHNTEGAVTLKETLDQYFPGKHKIFIVGVLRDKDYKSLIEAVIPGSEKVIAITPNSERALPAEELAIFIGNYCKNVLVGATIEEAVEKALALSSGDDVICAFGSLYYIGEIRALLKNSIKGDADFI
ncbi:MAG: bifunctional folylpolyglutamate synthase/dihydrofolate synthase [Clostridia bacterium]|nr:bifunctional folylpolyglutamate synthase/dihydrofolate synthase [Clostridia bacterium]